MQTLSSDWKRVIDIMFILLLCLCNQRKADEDSRQENMLRPESGLLSERYIF
jgi:hypothetical protein